MSSQRLPVLPEATQELQEVPRDIRTSQGSTGSHRGSVTFVFDRVRNLAGGTRTTTRVYLGHLGTLLRDARKHLNATNLLYPPSHLMFRLG